jgi:aspartokinase/homoserine dehydrogenase 1
MVERKGSAATLMSALANANINIKAIAQGSSEYNITVLIDQKDSERGLRAVHSRFYLSDTAIGVGIVGPGLIGATLIQQLKDQCEQLHREFKIDIRVLGIASSKKMLFKDTGIDLDNWKEEFDAKGEPCDLKKFGDQLRSTFVPNTCIIDCTASDVPASNYLSWMQKGIHVITPNKKLGSGPLEQYQAVRKIQREGYVHFFYEGTVGAGLPVMNTVKQLQETGDKVTRIEGILSGTLSYIFNTFGDGRSFSAIVNEAKQKGYTEPDPRDDLNGTDVARKVCILARETGLMVEMEDIPVMSLVPEPLRALRGGDEYMARLPEFDKEMETKLKEAEATGEVLRYVGVVDLEAGKGSVELRRYPKAHPFAQLNGTDNIISFTTKRYFKQALVVRGPGAGADVTAGGVFGDLLRLAAYLGAPS